jgi:hypothetical protein
MLFTKGSSIFWESRKKKMRKRDGVPSTQVGSSAARQQEVATLLRPQLNRLREAYIVRGEDASNVAAIPAQNRLTHQILQSHRAEQLCLRTKQRVEATVEESVLRTEMENFESQEEDAP